MNKTLLFVLVVVVMVLGFNEVIERLIVDPIPRRALTEARMQALKRRVILYARVHDVLPDSLAALPMINGYNNNTNDAWKRPITLEISSSGIVTFRSLGRDGVEGGMGDDSDIIRSFSSRETEGKWNDELVQWTEGETLR